MAAPDPNEKEAEKITEQIVQAVTAKVGKDRKFETIAFGAWQSDLKGHVLKRLKEGLDWKKAAANVLFVAREMGRIAEALADGDDVIEGKQLIAAFLACRSHKRCQTREADRGSWCDF